MWTFVKKILCLFLRRLASFSCSIIRNAQMCSPYRCFLTLYSSYGILLFSHANLTAELNKHTSEFSLPSSRLSDHRRRLIIRLNKIALPLHGLRTTTVVDECLRSGIYTSSAFQMFSPPPVKNGQTLSFARKLSGFFVVCVQNHLRIIPRI